MIRYILSRLGQALLAVFFVILFTFLLSRLVPGGPFMEEKSGTEAAHAEKMAFYHFDESLPVQFYYLFTDLLSGTLYSVTHRDRTVQEILLLSLPVSATIGWFALMLALFLGLFFGVWIATRPNSWQDMSVLLFTLLGISLPNFVLGAFLILFFGFILGLFPVAGWGQFPHLILPSITLALPVAAYITRLTRASMLESLQSDYIRTHRAFGLPKMDIYFKWALRNAFLPILTYMAPTAAGILTGSIVIEYLFAIPGIGQYFVQSVLSSDYNMLIGCVILYSSLVILFNLIVDILYSLLDPRIRVHS
jgi:oligopeptide transport system permease protein